MFGVVSCNGVSYKIWDLESEVMCVDVGEEVEGVVLTWTPPNYPSRSPNKPK